VTTQATLTAFDPREQLAVSVTYQDVTGLLTDACRKAVTRYGGDFDDYFSEAKLAFLSATRSHRERGGNMDFTTWLLRVVWFALKDVVKRKMRRHNSRPTEALSAEHAATLTDAQPVPGQFSEFLEDLSEDARLAVQLCLEMPEEIARIAAAKGDTDCNRRSTLRGYLKDTLGWSSARVAECFGEIRDALVS